jgi:hypothetical protein
MSFAGQNLVAPLRRFDLPPLASLVNLKALEKVDALLEEKSQGRVGRAMQNRLEKMRTQLRAVAPGSSAVFGGAFKETVESFFGHRRLLLQLYLLDEGAETKPNRLAHLKEKLNLHFLEKGRSSTRDYLPPFDRQMFRYLFGSLETLTWMDGIRAARLFFAHFRNLPAFEELGKIAKRLLSEAESSAHFTGKSRKWQIALPWIFTAEGPQKFCEALRHDETLWSGAERFGIPCPSSFYSVAQQYHLFSRLQRLPVGKDDPALFQEIQSSAASRFEAETTVGVKALQILIRRSIKENHSDLPEAWGSRISEFATDPRLPRRTKEFSVWWSWAADKEIRVALAWFTGRDLDAFIRVLDGSLEGDEKRMFNRRRDFLLKLFKAGKILRARLVLVGSTYQDVMRGLKKSHDVSVLRMNRSNGISVICIQCDGFSFVEGTHSYAIQLHHEIPVSDFWDSYGGADANEIALTEASFRQSRVDSVRHVDTRTMAWEQIFMEAISRHFHVYWDDVKF